MALASRYKPLQRPLRCLGCRDIAPFFRFVMNKQGLDSAALFAPPSVMDSIATGCLLAIYYRPLTYWVTRHRRWLWVVWPMAFLTPVLIVIGDNVHLFWPIPQISRPRQLDPV